MKRVISIMWAISIPTVLSWAPQEVILSGLSRWRSDNNC